MVNCRCGQAISSENLLMREYYYRPFGPHLVYLRFRCPFCKMTGEQFINQEDWNPNSLLPAHSPETESRKEVERLGPITSEERVMAYFLLEDVHSLEELNKLIQK